MAAGAAWLACALLQVLGAQAGGGDGGGGGDRRAVVAGEVRFGALFAVHGAPVEARAGSRCGAVREHYGIQRVEATLRALDAINADAALLPGLRLGAELRDSCWAPPTALRQTIDLVRDALSPPDPADSDARASKLSSTCSQEAGGARNTGHRAPLLGVLGPGASSASVQVQNLLQLFSIPQVSYSATSRELSDRARFSTFFRVVPSDLHQARTMVALLRAHNWTYVHAVHTDESYGQSGMAAFREEAARGGVCVAREEALRAAPGAVEVDRTLRRLASGPQVVVCWCEGRTARALLAGLARAGGPALRLVASDGWADRRDVVAGLERAANDALTLRIRSPYLRDFDSYYHSLKPHTNLRNPWFTEFWEQKFNCSMSDKSEVGIRRCTGLESLGTDYTQEPKLALVVRGVYALAHALHDMRAAACGARGPGLCAALRPFNVSLYRRHLARVRFRAPDGGLVAFDDNGDPLPELSEYDVMNLMSDGSGGWRYERVGRWRRGALQLRGGDAAAARRAAGVQAACSAPCGAGQWARAGEGRARCCWACVPCPPLAVTGPPPATGCLLCPPGHRPDVHRTSCLPSPVEWGGSEQWARSVALGAGGAGLAAVLACAATFWRHRATPVVKSASRELCALLLLSAAACHAAALASALRPAVIPCIAVRLAAPSLAGVYAAVLARTVRVARLVAAAERRPAARPRLLSSRAQVWTWVCLTAPGAAAAAWSAAAWAPAPRLLHPGRARSVLACGGERAPAQLLPLAPALALLASCVVLAVRTRRLPHNFNETKFVGAAAYATCVTWVAFFPLYAATAARTAALCACVSLSAGACVLLALGPRVWVCLCRPRRNTRAHFLTATSIRCHLGKYRPGAEPPSAADSPRAIVAHRDTSCQTEARGAGEGAEEGAGAGPGGWCAAAGACARVTRAPLDDGGDGGGDADVLIVLLHHHHAVPPAISDHSLP
ncbi:metabotropic glutamate receptor 1-like [Ostrinia nubilalis]|uniref:metabotropic glutamate receptor 1-like n=1 Tax=Ostrinia nubilalis TaxID=29057 RepID=UPI0030824DD5